VKSFSVQVTTDCGRSSRVLSSSPEELYLVGSAAVHFEEFSSIYEVNSDDTDGYSMSFEANYIGLNENDEFDSLWKVEDGANKFADPVACYVAAPDHREGPNLAETTYLESKTWELDAFVRRKPCERMEGEKEETRLKETSDMAELPCETPKAAWLKMALPSQRLMWSFQKTCRPLNALRT